MNTKLTLRLDEELIHSAKEYSAKTGKSISRIVADLFEILKNETQRKEPSLPPVVKSLRGVMKGMAIDEKDYKAYIERKYA